MLNSPSVLGQNQPYAKTVCQVEIMGDRAADDFRGDLGIWEGASIPAEHWHFHRRIFERYRMVLPPGAFSKMLRRLQAGPSKDALRIGRNILTGREVWGVYVPDGRAQRLLYIVWLPRRQAVITALPPSAWRYARFQRAKEELKEFRQRRRLPRSTARPWLPGPALPGSSRNRAAGHGGVPAGSSAQCPPQPSRPSFGGPHAVPHPRDHLGT